MKHHPDAVERALESSIPSGTVLAAVSGGPDSMAMLHALCALAERRNDLRVIAAHYDHQLRSDSVEDSKTVQAVANQYGAGLVVGIGNVAARARELHQSIEATAREMRYAFLESTADQFGADVIVTAHTRDDQTETIVMRLMRGAGDRGLRGIHERRGRILRPLLGVSRDDTITHCLDHGVPFVEDPTNRDTRFLRNHIRHDVLPALRSEHPELDAVLDEISARARGSYEQAERVTAPRLEELRHEGHLWWMPFSAFDGLDGAARVHLLMKVFRRMETHDLVARGHYAAMLRMLDERSTGKSVDLPEIRVRCEHDALVFMYRELVSKAPAVSKPLEVPGITRLGEWIVSSTVIDPAEARAAFGRPPEPGVAYVANSGSFRVRCPREGDRVRLMGLSGRRKLSDIFIDRKVPRRQRDDLPVVERDGEIVWVAGLATAESARVRDDTADVIRLAVRRRGASE